MVKAGANRITLGLGYPGLPMIFFLLAPIAGIGLVASILSTDVKARRKPGA